MINLITNKRHEIKHVMVKQNLVESSNEKQNAPFPTMYLFTLYH